MSDIYNWRGFTSSGGVLSAKGPIYQLDENYDIVTAATATNATVSSANSTESTAVTGKWLLAAELYITAGAIFYCKGASAGGDCDELRIQSTGPDDWYEVSVGAGHADDTSVHVKTKKLEAHLPPVRCWRRCRKGKNTEPNQLPHYDRSIGLSMTGEHQS